MKQSIIANYSLVSDFASIGEGGKLNIMGVFKSINVSKFPTTHPHFYLAVSITVPGKGNYKQKIDLIKKSTKKLLVPSFEFNLNVTEDKKSDFNSLVQLVNTQFTDPGEYEFKVYVNSELITSTPFTVSESEQQ